MVIRKVLSFILTISLFCGLFSTYSIVGNAAATSGLIKDMKVMDSAKASGWSVKGDLKTGDTQYGDRTFVFVKIPQYLIGCERIQPAMESRVYPNDPLVTFTVTADTTIFVAHNDYYPDAQKPDWIKDSSWTNTKETVTNGEATLASYTLFSKFFKANSTVTLGRNSQKNETKAMYLVFAVSGNLSNQTSATVVPTVASTAAPTSVPTAAPVQTEQPKAVQNIPLPVGEPMPANQQDSTVKWNPGHYVLTYTSHSLKDLKVMDKTAFQGAEVVYYWGNLELEEGKYDFSAIDRDLDYLKSMNKRLIIQIQDKCMQSDKYAPDYICEDPKYKGGFMPFIAGENDIPKRGGVLRLWDPAVNERWQALLTEIGKRYDNDPYVEAFVTSECTFTVNKYTAPDFNQQNWIDALKANFRLLKKVFPNTLVFQSASWTQPQALIQDSYSIGGGQGATDVAPKAKIYSFPIMSQYVNKMPMEGEVADSELGAVGWTSGNTVKEMFDFGVDTLHLDHFCWQQADAPTNNPQFTRDIVPYLVSQNFRINTAVPENIKVGPGKPAYVVPTPKADDISVNIDGQPVTFLVPPQIVNDRVLVPMREIFEGLGVKVEWDDKTNTVSATKGSIHMSLVADSNKATVNGQQKTLDVSATIQDGRTLVPVRFISDALGVQDVIWNDEDKCVRIFTHDKDFAEAFIAKHPKKVKGIKIDDNPKAGIISNLVVNDTDSFQSNYKKWSINENLQKDNLLYGDRTYKITAVPAELAGSAWISTAMDSKTYVANPVIATFTVKADADVYIAQETTIPVDPDWLKDWTPVTDYKLSRDVNNSSYKFFKKTFSAGSSVDLGLCGGKNMYIVVVKPAGK